MISEPVFEALTAAPWTASESQVPLGGWAEPAWPANEIVLSALLRTGRSAEDIAELYRVLVREVAQRLSLAR